MRADAPTTRQAIRQSRPFRSPGQEAVVALMLAVEVLRGRFEELVQGDLTLQQYNVLRILRGAGADGLPTLDIAERLIERTPGITRLLDRLEAKGLVERRRGREDRRQVLCRLTERGHEVLAGLDPAVDRLDDQALSCLSKARQRALIADLNRIRVHNAHA